MAISTAHIRQRARQIVNDLPRLLEDPDRQDTLRNFATRTADLAERVAAEEQKITQNPYLTAEGKQSQLRALATKMTNDLKFQQQALEKITTAHADMTGVLFTPEGQRQLDKAMGRAVEPLESDATVRFLREREIRDAVRAKAQHERDALYLKAINARDGETIAALSNAPGGPLVSADLKRRADADYAARAFPAAHKNFVQIEALREQLQGLRELTTQWLDGLGAQS